MPSSVSGVAALDVLTISKEPSAFLTNQVQEEPKLLIAESVNFALNSSNEPNAALIASATAPVGSPPAFGARQCQ